MRLSDFDYDLPNSYIAQKPIEPRDSSRLLVLDRKTGAIEHRQFNEIGRFLHPGDLLVVNKTRVIQGRLFARKPTGGQVEILLLRRLDDQSWECIIGGKGIKQDLPLQLEQNGPQAVVTGVLDGARRLLRFSKPIDLYLPRLGHTPLPPYIHTPLENPERYQTVFAQEMGSAAAPTAGLHFTKGLIKNLKLAGIQVAELTLHVGLDTFLPITELDPRNHKIHSEWCDLPVDTAEAVNKTRASGGRVIAVGTTSVRTLESAACAVRIPGSELMVSSYTGFTDLFIMPGYEFKIVDCMITNFHLPCSTLIMMVSAFAAREQILETYEVAKREGYRFYSFGDAMLIL